MALNLIEDNRATSVSLSLEKSSVFQVFTTSQSFHPVLKEILSRSTAAIVGPGDTSTMPFSLNRARSTWICEPSKVCVLQRCSQDEIHETYNED